MAKQTAKTGKPTAAEKIAGSKAVNESTQRFNTIHYHNETGEHKKVAARARHKDQDFGTKYSRTIVNRVIAKVFWVR